MARLGVQLLLLLVCFLTSLGGLEAQTTEEVCSTPDAPILDLTVTDDPIDFASTLYISDLEVGLDLTHTFIGNLEIDLISPIGTSVILHNNGCCGTGGILLTYSDAGVAYGSVSYSCDCLMQPWGELSTFFGELSGGIWTLSVDDQSTSDEGTLDEWCLSITGCGVLPPVDLSCDVSVLEDEVTLSWSNDDVYDSVDILRDGEVVASVDGDETSYVESGLDPGIFRFAVSGVSDALACGSESQPCTAVVGGEQGCSAAAVDFTSGSTTTDTLELFEARYIDDMQVSVDVTHGFNGALSLDLNSPTGTLAELHSGLGGVGANLDVNFTDSGVPHASTTFACRCDMQPFDDLATFGGEFASGIWELTVTETFFGAGSLNEWCVTVVGCDLLAPSGLECRPEGADIVLTWSNEADYDSIDVLWNGTLLESIDGGEETFTHGGPANYNGLYGLIGRSDSAACGSRSDTCQVSYFDGFEDYPAGESLVPQGGWRYFDYYSPAPGIVTDVVANSGLNALLVDASTQLVRTFSGRYTEGDWAISIWIQVPSGATGVSYIYLLSDYEPIGVKNYAALLYFDTFAGTISSFGGSGFSMPGSVDIIEGRWIELRVLVDLDENTQEIYYGGELLASGVWTVTGPAEIAAIGLLGLSIAPEILYDDFSVLRDCNGNEVDDVVDLATGSSEDCDSNGVPDECDTDDIPLAGKLLPSTVPDDGLSGVAVAATRDLAVLGAPTDDSLNGTTGLAVVFRRNDSTGEWEEEQTLTPSDGGIGDQFGAAVGISGDWILIGAPRNDTEGSNAGAVYAFQWDTTAFEWVEEAKLTGSDSDGGDDFGYALAMDGDVALIGARFDDEVASNAGAAYVFERSGLAWSEAQKLTAGDGAGFDEFGAAVALRGCPAVAGARRDDDGASSTGSAYVFGFDEDRGEWVEDDKLTASDGTIADEFGTTVATNGSELFVGVPLEDSSTANTGAVYAYRFDGPTQSWVEQKLIRDGADPGEAFGSSAATVGAFAAFGAPFREESIGAVYLYALEGTEWVPAGELNTGGFATADDRFGTTVALGGPSLLVGAPYNDDSEENSGAAYLFALADCNGNDVVDICDIDAGTSLDANGNGLPDECEGGAGECADLGGGDGPLFRRGDCDGNGGVSALLDSLFLLSWQFSGGPAPACLDAADADGNNNVSALLDSLYLLAWQFSGGPAPPSPGQVTCGPDNDGDAAVGCATPPAACN